MYVEYYGLTDEPFQPTPDPAFYFDSQTHRKAMAYLGYGLAQGEGCIVITGETGTGKTMLVGHLMATIDRARLTGVRLGGTEGEEGLRLAAESLGIPCENGEKAEILGDIERHLRAEAAQGRRTLLIVDDAHRLSATALEELRALSRFQIEGQALAQLFLLGQPALQEMLRTDALEPLRERVLASHHLEPMQPEEIGPYIAHRLSRAGWRDRPSFTPDAFAALHRHSEGVPGALNALAERLLALGAREQRDTLDAEAVECAARPPAGEQEVPAEPDTAARIAALEARVEEQEAALRRVLTLLIDWVESDSAYAPGSGRRHDAA